MTMTGRDASADDGNATVPDGGSTEESTHSAAPPEDPAAGDGGPGDADAGPADDHDRDRRTDDGGGLSDGVALAVSLLFGFALAVGSVLLVTWLDPAFEGLLRIHPTDPGGGVGAGWTAGNADFWLDLLITLVHLADVVMGIFILVMVFVHWAAFRRLAARMQPPGGHPRDRRTPATDGGSPDVSGADVPTGTGDASPTAEDDGGDGG